MRHKATFTISWEFDHQEDPLAYAKNVIDNIPIPNEFKTNLEVIDVKKSGVIHQKTFEPNYVFDKIRDDEEKVSFKIENKIYELKMNNQRYKLFKSNRFCVSCGLEGTMMILDTYADGSNPHFGLYGEEDGKLVLFTKDHIKPKTFGGKNEISNYQTMCEICNGLKDCYDISPQDVNALREISRNKNNLPKRKLVDIIRKQRLMMINSLDGA